MEPILTRCGYRCDLCLAYRPNIMEAPRTTFRFAVTILSADTASGIVKLSRQWELIREWDVGWGIRLQEWGNGYAGEAAKAVMDWAFRELNVHRIVAFCHADNVASVQVMEKLGMHQDGRLRETEWVNGRWWDEYVYFILEREWDGFKRPHRFPKPVRSREKPVISIID